MARSPILRAIAAAGASSHVLWGVFGATYLLFATDVLGLTPAAIGLIVGMGGAGAFVGALLAGRASRRFGVGPAMLVGMIGFTIGMAFIPLAPAGALLIGAIFLVAQQIVGDGAATVYEIASVSVTQSVVDDRLIGRVNGTIRFVEDLFQLGGTIAGGIIGELLGLRVAAFVGLIGAFVAIAFLWFSPIRRCARSRPIRRRSACPATICRRPSSRSGEQGGHERVRVERQQVADLLADADEPDGTLSASSMAKTIPPLDVESSFVRTTPVNPTASWKARAWARPFWPVVASSTNSVSGRAPGSRLSTILRTFASSSMRLTWCGAGRRCRR